MKCLKIIEVPHTVCEVNRGYVSTISKPKMILPFSSDCIEEMLNIYRKIDENGNYEPTWKLDQAFMKKLNAVASKYKEFTSKTISQNVIRTINSLVMEKGMEIKNKGEYTYEAFMKLTVTEKTYKTLFSKLQEKFPMYNSSMEEEDLLSSKFNKIKTRKDFPKFIEFLAFLYSGLEDVIENHFSINRLSVSLFLEKWEGIDMIWVN